MVGADLSWPVFSLEQGPFTPLLIVLISVIIIPILTMVHGYHHDPPYSSSEPCSSLIQVVPCELCNLASVIDGLNTLLSLLSLASSLSLIIIQLVPGELCNLCLPLLSTDSTQASLGSSQWLHNRSQYDDIMMMIY